MQLCILAHPKDPSPPPMETPDPPFMTPLGPQNRWFWHPMTSQIFLGQQNTKNVSTTLERCSRMCLQFLVERKVEICTVLNKTPVPLRTVYGVHPFIKTNTCFHLLFAMFCWICEIVEGYPKLVRQNNLSTSSTSYRIMFPHFQAVVNSFVAVTAALLRGEVVTLKRFCRWGFLHF